MHPPNSTAIRHRKIAIISSELSGFGMDIHLKQAGEDDFLLFEKEADVGSTWPEVPRTKATAQFGSALLGASVC